VRHDIEATRRRLASPRLIRRAAIAAVALLAVVSAGSGIWFWGMRPSGDVPKNLAAFVGRWDGIWDNDPQLTTSLTIESVSPTGEVTASYVYMSLGPSKLVGRITDNAVSLAGPIMDSHSGFAPTVRWRRLGTLLANWTQRFLRTSQLSPLAAGREFGITILKRLHRSPLSPLARPERLLAHTLLCPEVRPGLFRRSSITP
jgi:hypothetical protein